MSVTIGDMYMYSLLGFAPAPYSFGDDDQDTIETKGFGLAQFSRVVDRKGPSALRWLRNANNGEYGQRYLPHAYLTALMEGAMASEREHQMSRRSKRNLWQAFYPVAKQFYRRAEALYQVGCGYSAFQTLEVSQLTGPQIDAETLHCKLNLNFRAFLYDRVPHLDLISRIMFSLHVDEANPGVVMWYEGSREVPFAAQKVHSARWSKFFGMMNRKYGFRFPDRDIEEVSNWVGDNLRSPKYHMTEVSGQAVVEGYREEYFGSCMHESRAIQFYADQPNVRALRIEDPEGKFAGRALIWEGVATNGDVVTVLDRIYPSDGGAHIRAAILYATTRGWMYKLEQAIGGPLSDPRRINVEVIDTGYWPYMDTFAYPVSTPDSAGRFLLSNSDWDVVAEPMHNTSNCSPFEEELTVECDQCGDALYEDEVLSGPDGNNYCANCHAENFICTDLEGEEYPIDDVVTVFNIQGREAGRTANMENENIIWSEPDQEWYLMHEVTVRWNNSYIPAERVIEITDGEYDGEYTIESNIVWVGDVAFYGPTFVETQNPIDFTL